MLLTRYFPPFQKLDVIKVLPEGPIMQSIPDECVVCCVCTWDETILRTYFWYAHDFKRSKWSKKGSRWSQIGFWLPFGTRCGTSPYKLPGIVVLIAPRIRAIHIRIVTAVHPCPAVEIWYCSNPMWTHKARQHCHWSWLNNSPSTPLPRSLAFTLHGPSPFSNRFTSRK